MREWNKYDVQSYIQNYNEKERDSVLSILFEADLLERVMATSQGKVLLNDVVDTIHASVRKVIRGCLDGFDENELKIRQSAQELNTAYSLLRKWASMLDMADQHEGRMDKK